MTGLTDDEVAILAMEREWWKHPGSKDTAIRERFGITPTRYYQLLGQLIDRDEAHVADPVTVKRLRRIRDQRAVSRRRLRAG